MGQLLVRSVDDVLIRSLKQRAARAGRSVEAEHRAILTAALLSDTESFAVMAARVRANTPLQTDFSSEDLIRRDRDRDHPMDAT